MLPTIRTSLCKLSILNMNKEERNIIVCVGADMTLNIRGVLSDGVLYGDADGPRLWVGQSATSL